MHFPSNNLPNPKESVNLKSGLYDIAMDRCSCKPAAGPDVGIALVPGNLPQVAKKVAQPF